MISIGSMLGLFSGLAIECASAIDFILQVMIITCHKELMDRICFYFGFGYRYS
jgi:hypothetical protein